jgi:hypothetical protein
MSPESIQPTGQGEVIVYKTEDGRSAVSLRMVDGSVWLTQLKIAELFDTSKQNISLHIKNVLSSRELMENAVVKEYLTTATDGKSYRTLVYNLL